MVDKTYMLEKPAGPSAFKLFLDQRVLPLAIDVAGAGEVAVQRLSRRTGVPPALVVGAVAGACMVAAAFALARRRPAAEEPTIEARVRAAM